MTDKSSKSQVIGRPKGQETISVSVRIPTHLKKEIDAYSEKTGISQTFIFTKAISEYLEQKKLDSK